MSCAQFRRREVDKPRRARSKAGQELMTRHLGRVGVEQSAPSASALTRLHHAHVELVPYETFWLHLDDGWGIAPHDSIRRIAVDGRGGYCFHLNAAFAELLDWLGYTVCLHPAGVHDANGPNPSTIGNHVALTVHDLPIDPTPLVLGTSTQDSETVFTSRYRSCRAPTLKVPPRSRSALRMESAIGRCRSDPPTPFRASASSIRPSRSMRSAIATSSTQRHRLQASPEPSPHNGA
jgi:N-acetyltransferase